MQTCYLIKKTLIQRFYVTNKALSTTKQVQVIDETDFAITILNADSKTFIVHMIIQKQEKMAINFVKKAQIKA